jgi:hypothetical protein
MTALCPIALPCAAAHFFETLAIAEEVRRAGHDSVQPEKDSELDDRPAWGAGRLKSVAAVLANIAKAVGDDSAGDAIEAAWFGHWLQAKALPLLEWLHARWMTERFAVVEIEERQAPKPPAT